MSMRRTTRWLLTALAERIGNNLHGEVIPLGPFYIAAALIVAACLGLLGRLALDSIRDW